jgi:hypothetical protein
MEFQAKYVSTETSVDGDYYQAIFTVEQDRDDDSDSPYLLLQRDFEMPYEGTCYVETHNENYRGHFFLRRIDLMPHKLEIELDRPINNLVCVTLSLTASQFEEVSRMMKIIGGQVDPK